MAGLKTKRTDASPEAFVDGIEDPGRQAESRELIALMRNVTGKPPAMWGKDIVGFGSYHYRYRSGREGDWFVTGFSPRKRNLSIYVMPGFSDYQELLGRLGRHKTAVSCLYLRRLDDVDRGVLRELLAASVKDMARIYDCE